MRGQVLGVDIRTGQGVVAGDDGQRYTFGQEDWAREKSPVIGVQVDFEIEGRSARSVFPIGAPHVPAVATPAPVNDRNKVVAAVLALFIGTLGVHRFYLGRTGSGIVMLILSITVIGLALTVPWAFIDAIRYLVMSDDTFAARYARR